MEMLSVILQGILQGLTEFLPVSSSGHLSVYRYFAGESGQEGFFLSIVLHAGTLAAVCVCFWGELRRLVLAGISLLGDAFRPKEKREMTGEKRTLLCMVLSCVPLLAAPFLSDGISALSSDRDITVEGFCFLVTGILLLYSGRPGKIGAEGRDGGQVTWLDGLWIGLGQLLALLPGVSRSGATVSVGRIRGLSPAYTVSYSFILGIPAVLGAILLETGKALEQGLETPPLELAAGFVTAMVSGILAIRLVRWLVRGDKFRYFGYYTLLLGVVLLAVGFLR